jgi:hypothetical protein
MNTLNFNDADLKANREGRLSDAQQKRLNTDVAMIRQHSKYMLWVFAATFAVMAIVVVFNKFKEEGQDLNKLFSSVTLVSGRCEFCAHRGVCQRRLLVEHARPHTGRNPRS